MTATLQTTPLSSSTVEDREVEFVARHAARMAAALGPGAQLVKLFGFDKEEVKL